MTKKNDWVAGFFWKTLAEIVASVSVIATFFGGLFLGSWLVDKIFDSFQPLKLPAILAWTLGYFAVSASAIKTWIEYKQRTSKRTEEKEKE